MRKRHLVWVAIAITALVGCDEKEVGSQSCPILCPEQSVTVKDTTLDAVASDTTIDNFPTFGAAAQLVIALAGDTLDSRAIIRFDSIATDYLPVGFTIDSARRPITNPDSVNLLLRVDTLHSRVSANFTLDLFDVDTLVADSVTAALIPLFRPGRLIGSRTFTKAQLLDTLRIPIGNAALLARLNVNARVRIGVRITSAASAMIRVGGSEGAAPSNLNYKGAPDSGLVSYAFLPHSNTPPRFASAQSAFTDFSLFVIGVSPLAPQTLGVGGLPARRPVLRFTLPTTIIDSSEVIRATLMLTQVPNFSYRFADPVGVYPLVLVSTAHVTDPFRAASLAIPLIGGVRQRYPAHAWTDSVSMTPAGTGVRSFEVTALLREWRLNGAALQRAIVFRVADEGFDVADIRFYNHAAPVALRPRIHILYVPGNGRLTP